MRDVGSTRNEWQAGMFLNSVAKLKAIDMMTANSSICQHKEFLVEVDLFKHLPESCLDSLVNDSRTLDCSAGHLFFQAGQIGNSLFVLETGCVRIFRTCCNKTLTISKIDRPGIFGESGCFGTGKHYSSAEALCDSRVRMISRASIEALLECAPHAAHKFIDLMGQRCAHILRKMEIVARKGLIPQIATLLIERAENGVVSGMTHADLAGHLGLHREAVTTTLGQLRSAGMIKIERKRISILQRERLERAT
jgi:CRP-like cAMP-binding protein